MNDHGKAIASQCTPECHDIWTEWEKESPDFLDELYLKHVDPEDDGSVQARAPIGSQTKRKKHADADNISQFSSKRRRQVGDPNTPGRPMAVVLEPGQFTSQENLREDEVPALVKALNNFIDCAREAQGTDQMNAVLAAHSIGMSVGIEKLRSSSCLYLVPAELFRKAFALIAPCITGCTKELNEGPEDANAQDLARIQVVMRCVLLILAAAAGRHEQSGNEQICVETTLEACTFFLDAFLGKRILAPMDSLLSEQAKQSAEHAKGNNRKLRKHHDAALQDLASQSSPICQGLIMLNEILHLHPVQDKELLRITSICLSAFFHDGAEHLHVLQSVSIPIMQTIFAAYEAHRQNTLSELFARMGTWQVVSCKERCFQLQPSASGHVQMLSALVLALFQGCNSPPAQVVAFQTVGSAATLGATAQSANTKPAIPLFVGFIKKFLNKFAEAEKAGRRVDRDTSVAHKKFLEVFCKDVCTVLGLPEFPIAVLAQRILWKVAFETSKADTFHMTYRTMATDMLGDIILALKRHAMRVPAFITDMSLPNPLIKATDGGSRHVHKSSAIGAAPDKAGTCMQLSEQMHGLLKRLGLDTAGEELEREWNGAGKDASAARAHVYSLYCKQLLLNHVTSCCAKSDKSMCHARHVYLSDWCDEPDCSDAIMRCWCAQWELPPEVLTTDAPLPSSAEASEVACYTLVLSAMPQGYNYVLNPLLVLLTHGNQAIRQKALKGFSRIVDLDPSTLRQGTVRAGVCSLMSDVSTSVRATAVSLVGSYMHSSKEMMMQYFESICGRCQDTGTSVRKTAMNILKECLATAHSEPSIVERACVALVPLLRDESQDIRTRASAILKEMWFPPAADGKKERASSKRVSIEARFDQIKGVVTAAHSNLLVGITVLNVLEQFFRDVIQEGSVNQEACRQFCEHGVQLVIAEHEDRAGEHSAGELVTVHLQLFRTLALFAKANPQLLVKQAHLLHQYLTGHDENSQQWTADQCHLTGTVASIYNCVLPHVKPLPPTLIKYLQADLPKLIRFVPNMHLITSSIQCLCTLTKSAAQSQSNMARPMLGMLFRFFQSYSAILAGQNESLKPRAIIICGMLCRYSNFKLTLPGDSTEGTKKATAIEDEHVTALYETCVRQYAVSILDISFELCAMNVKMCVITATRHVPGLHDSVLDMCCVQHQLVITLSLSCFLIAVHLASPGRKIFAV